MREFEGCERMEMWRGGGVRCILKMVRGRERYERIEQSETFQR
jgi:hypothetical protein